MRHPAITFTALLVLLAVGCNQRDANRAAVNGKVTLDGEPLVQGAIKFTPLSGTPGVITGTDIKNGEYKLPAEIGAAVGPNEVKITAMRKTGKFVQSPLGPPGEKVEMEESAVAPQFNVHTKLKVNIKPGDNVQDFPVTSK